jgi:hypothetical protein
MGNEKRGRYVVYGSELLRVSKYLNGVPFTKEPYLPSE